MSLRAILLFALASGTGGCVVTVHEGPLPPQPAPGPMTVRPAPGHAYAQPQAVPPAPGTPSPGARFTPHTEMVNPNPPPQGKIIPPPRVAPPQSEGELIVRVSGGNCDIIVDGADLGQRTEVDRQVGYGEHEISCNSAAGGRQAQRASVSGPAPVVVNFTISSGGRLPVVVGPPVGRPHPR